MPPPQIPSPDTSSIDRQRLERLLGRPETERLLAALRRRLERGGGDAITLSDVTGAERHAIETLLGRGARTGTSLRLRLADLEATLKRAEIAPSLRSAVEALTGPIIDHGAEKRAAAARWERVVEQTRPRADALGLSAWLERIHSTGLVKRIARDGGAGEGAHLLDAALSVIERLPGRGISLSSLAAETLGDAHGLDRGKPVAALVRSSLAAKARQASQNLASGPDATEDERLLWAFAGVLVGGDVTSTALTLNLPALPTTATGQILATARAVGEPTYLTLRQLVREPPAWRCAGQRIFVCENPAVVAEAASRLGAGAAPLVATWGRPKAAARILLESLCNAGAELIVQTDFDWYGLSIARDLLSLPGARPWHLMTATVTSHAHLPGPSLKGNRVDTPWDPQLARVLEARGRALEEEQILDLLLQSLASETSEDKVTL